MDKEFDKSVGEERDRFVIAVREQEWDTKLRTAAENILVMYDQMREKLAAPSLREQPLREDYNPCGGCGAAHPRDRCINCMHDFILKEKRRCEYELYVEEHFGLSKIVNAETRLTVAYADLVNMLAMFDAARTALEGIPKPPQNSSI